jgi:hypothetical protein
LVGVGGVGENLGTVGEAVVIRVGVGGIGQVRIDLGAVAEAVAVGVGDERIGAALEFAEVVQSVGIAVEDGVARGGWVEDGWVIEFPEIGDAVAVGVGQADVGAGGAAGLNGGVIERGVVDAEFIEGCGGVLVTGPVGAAEPVVDVVDVGEDEGGGGFGVEKRAVAPVTDQAAAGAVGFDGDGVVERLAEDGGHAGVEGGGAAGPRAAGRFVAPFDALDVVIGAAGSGEGEVVAALAAAADVGDLGAERVAEIEDSSPVPTAGVDGDPAFESAFGEAGDDAIGQIDVGGSGAVSAWDFDCGLGKGCSLAADDGVFATGHLIGDGGAGGGGSRGIVERPPLNNGRVQRQAGNGEQAAEGQPAASGLSGRAGDWVFFHLKRGFRSTNREKR